jgi:gliding motility-associated-like protein
LIVPEGVTLVLDLGRDETISLGDSIQLEPFYNFDPASWTWTPTDGLIRPDSISTYAAPTSTTLYQLEMIDAKGCRISDQVRIIVTENIPAYLPTAFSPNEDGRNDVFMIFGKGIEEVESFQVFDRWGNQVFADGGFLPNDPAHGWDGRVNGEPLNAAVFVYWVRLRLTSGKSVQLEGEVLLLR